MNWKNTPPKNVFRYCNAGLPASRRGREVCRLFLFYCFPKQTRFLQAVPISFVPRPASQKNSRKTKCELQTSHFPRTMCHTKERERDKREEGWGDGGEEGREAEELLWCCQGTLEKKKRKEELLEVTEGKSCELCNCKYATGRLPTISKDLRFQNRRGGLTDLCSGSWSFQEHLYVSESQKLPHLFIDSSSHTWSAFQAVSVRNVNRHHLCFSAI